MIFKYFKRRKALQNVLFAAVKMSQRLQSLPWYKSSDGTKTIIARSVWREWNYKECDRLINSVIEYAKYK